MDMTPQHFRVDVQQPNSDAWFALTPRFETRLEAAEYVAIQVAEGRPENRYRVVKIEQIIAYDHDEALAAAAREHKGRTLDEVAEHGLRVDPTIGG